MSAVLETQSSAPLALVNRDGNALAEQQHSMFNLDGMAAMQKMAELMSTATVTIPKHLVNKPGDCLAVVMQAAQWEMNPYAVAQKTHLTQGGQLGYEAQLINAVVIARAPIKERPKFEFFGDWSKILGKVKEMKGATGGKYYVSDWAEKDEAGLGVRCSAVFRGETEPREVELLLVQCWPRFSTQWATDPQQQITYAAVRKWSRRYSPDVILGVYTPEELAEIPAGERDMGAADVVTNVKPDIAARVRQATGHEARQPAANKVEPPTLDEALALIKAGNTPEEMTRAGETVAKLVNGEDREKARAAYRARIADLKRQAAEAKAAAEAAQKPTESTGGPTYAEVADMIARADSVAAVNAALDLARSFKDDSQREELIELGTKRADDLTPV